VEFNAGGLESQEPFMGCAFHIHGFGDELMKFMFEVAYAGDMVMMPAMEGNPLILVSESQQAHIPAEILELLRPCVIRSGAELKAVLNGGFEGWAAYRDQIVRGASQGSVSDDAGK
jgi:hypothetical protein